MSGPQEWTRTGRTVRFPDGTEITTLGWQRRSLFIFIVKGRGWLLAHAPTGNVIYYDGGKGAKEWAGARYVADELLATGIDWGRLFTDENNDDAVGTLNLYYRSAELRGLLLG